MKEILLLFFLVLFDNIGHSQVIWDGGAGTTNWADKANWVGDVVPTTTTDVIIDGFNVTMNVDGFCASLELKGTSTFTVGGVATLKIEEAPYDTFHIKVNHDATLTNIGFIDIKNQSAITVINDGQFDNQGLLETEESPIAFLNESKGNFVNNGDIHILRCAIGIKNEGLFRNENEITIHDVTAFGFGINTDTELINGNHGEITITQIAQNSPAINISQTGRLANGGIIIMNGAASHLINNHGHIENDGSIQGSNGISGIINRGMLNNRNEIQLDSLLSTGISNYDSVFNEIGAVLNIRNADFGINGRSASSFFSNRGSVDISIAGTAISERGEFTNSDSITIDTFSSNGIRCRGGTFTNEASGVVDIMNGFTGVTGTGLFSNLGKVTIENVSQNGIILNNNGKFDQSSTGSFLLNQSVAPDFLIINSNTEFSILGTFEVSNN